MGVREQRAGTYFPAVQTANKGEGTDRGAVQPHVVAPQDEIMQLQAVERFRLGCVQATHKATGANVNRALARERAGILSGQYSSRHPPTHTEPGRQGPALPLPLL